MVLWHLTLFGQTNNITKIISSVLTSLLVESVMPPVTTNARVAKKAMLSKKKIIRVSKQATLETAGENASSMKSILTTLTAVLSSLTHNQDDQDVQMLALGVTCHLVKMD